MLCKVGWEGVGGLRYRWFGWSRGLDLWWEILVGVVAHLARLPASLARLARSEPVWISDGAAEHLALLLSVPWALYLRPRDRLSRKQCFADDLAEKTWSGTCLGEACDRGEEWACGAGVESAPKKSQGRTGTEEQDKIRRRLPQSWFDVRQSWKTHARVQSTHQKTHRHPIDWIIAALTRGTKFLPPSKSKVYTPRRYARSCRKNISAIVAEGRHSTGLTTRPWKMRATTRDEYDGDLAHHTDERMKQQAVKRYTGRFPKAMAVGDAMTLPIPSPIMYKPVVRAT